MVPRWMVCLLVVASSAAGCAAVERERPDLLHGTSGVVSWEVIGIRTAVPPDGRAIQWSYTLILRNTGGPDIQFETLEISAQSASTGLHELLSGVQREPFGSRLMASGELRVNTSYQVAFTASASSGFGELPGGREGLVVLYRFLGTDSGGRPVVVAVRVPLDPATGRRVAPGPARATAPSPSPAAATEPRDQSGGGAPTRPEAPPPGPRTPAPKPGSGTALLLEAARECQLRFPAIEAVSVDADGRVTFHSREVGISAPFQACYEERSRVKTSGRRVPAPVAADRTSVALGPEQGALVVRVVLGQSQPARLLVDTGATKTVLRPDMLERLGIPIEPDAIRVTLTTASGERIPGVPLARLGSLTVGDVTVEDLYVAAYDVLPDSPAVDGLLGLDFLGHFQVRIDRAAASITLEARP